MFCLMSNHIHLVVETPQGNISRFMQSLTTGYTVYYNLKNKHSGHLFQGRFGAKLVEGDSYLLKLTRYVHLNPVFIAAVKRLQLEERLARLNSYRWSSYRGYIDKSSALDFVEYGPVLAMVDGRGRAIASGKYREFVESGIVQSDEEFKKVKDGSPHSIGSLGFDCRVRKLYKKMIEERDKLDDVAFRNMIEPLAQNLVVGVICKVFGVSEDYVYTRQRGGMVRPVAAQMLCKYAGMTQREVAKVLNLTSGAAVSSQLRKLNRQMSADKGLMESVEQITVEIEELRDNGD